MIKVMNSNDLILQGLSRFDILNPIKFIYVINFEI